MKYTALTLSILVALVLTIDTDLQAQDCKGSSSVEGSCAIDTSGLAMNELQTVGSHNSYKLAIPEAELALIRAHDARMALTLDYAHLPLTEQLNLGMRQLELDIVYDPEGGRYADPLLPRQTAADADSPGFDNRDLLAPGFKVLHSQDIDVRSNCMTWIACLEEIRRWSDANPRHVPLLIMFNAKEGGSSYPGVTPALDFTSEAFSALDRETLSVFSRDRLITPDTVRGEFDTLRAAVLAGNWPGLDDARGKVFFALDEGPEKVRRYLRGNHSLQGLPFFVNSISEQADHAAYFTINNPLESFERIQATVRAGFIVRTRADANTFEARNNDYSRQNAAFASGAHYISTDYYLPRATLSDYQVQLPGGAAARCNPLLVRDCH